ncbi:hypothetical protein PCASD_18184 [Puccinia coronata f. sp. avenae]|uniref:Uncharacterized protein n=1 Tax=Puccinia coronata f. sp. avenae TaxID=200324 RepID=A0A2N5T2A8_9BASI|nr:hypothetical protein PCASD_18184 [Puccinia coronata f. sp. avenae]
MFCKLTIASLFTILATASPSPARPLLHYAAPSQRSRVAVSPSTLASKIELHAQVRQSNKAFYEDVTKDAAPVVLLWHDKLSRTALSQDWDYWASLSDEVRELSLVHPDEALEAGHIFSEIETAGKNEAWYQKSSMA